MNEMPSFELIEDHAFTGQKSLRLKGNYIKFRGFNGDIAPVVARKDQIEKFVDALNFLDVWRWKSDYDPVECGFCVLDGKSWSFKAVLMDLNCATGGTNAYPSFSDVLVASLNPQRYDYLVYAIESSFDIDHIHLRKALAAG